MSNRKPAPPAKEPVSQGATLAAKYRPRASDLTDEQRQAHRAHAMSIIYGNPNGKTFHARSR
jgi:hypothetical protein